MMTVCLRALGDALLGGAVLVVAYLCRPFRPLRVRLGAPLMLWYLRRGTAILAAALLLQTSAVAGESVRPDCETRPPWCEKGYVCVPTACAAESAAQLRLLIGENDVLRARRGRRFHADLTCGPGIGTALTEDFSLRSFPTPGACVVGLAIRLGR